MNRIQGTLIVIRVQIPNGLAHHQRQFDLIVQVGSLRAQHRTFAGAEDSGSGLQEEKGLLGLGVVQLCDVVAAVDRLR